MHAGQAVDAVPLQPGGAVGFRGLAPRDLAARLAPPFAIGDGQRVLVHHRALDARPGAGIDADLFAREAAKEKGGRGHDGDGGIGDRVAVPGDQIAQQRRRIGEIEHPGAAGQQPDQQPRGPFHRPQPRLAGVPALFIQPDLGVAVALDPALDKDEQVGPDRLRAGIAAPHPPQRRGEQEQPQPGHDQQPGDEIELVRPDLDPEEEKAAVGQIHQHRLIGQPRPPVPADPRGDVVDAQRHRHQHPFEASELSLHPARKDGFARRIEAWGFLLGRGHPSLLLGRVSYTPCRGGVDLGQVPPAVIYETTPGDFRGVLSHPALSQTAMPNGTSHQTGAPEGAPAAGSGQPPRRPPGRCRQRLRAITRRRPARAHRSRPRGYGFPTGGPTMPASRRRGRRG